MIEFEGSMERSRDVIRQIFLSDQVLSLGGEGYQGTMRDLFMLGFCEHFADTTAQRRIGYRRKSAKIAAAQRLAMSILRSLVDQHHISLSKSTHHDTATDSTASGCEAGIGASIAPCQWLQVAETADDTPYYLWDVEQRRSVISQTLKKPVEYTAISHTWGRFEIPESRPLRVEGVEEWLVSQNSRFNVLRLPDILLSAGFKTRFIWLDLLCIPQKPESDSLQRIAAEEVSRQARIFHAARYAVAWLNDVSEWKGMHAAVSRLAICYLLLRGYELPPCLAHLGDAEAEIEIEFVRNTKDAWGQAELNSWFTSLWTLQELCLRPDMVFYDRQWNPLTVGPASKTPVRLDDLAELISLTCRELPSRNRTYSSKSLAPVDTSGERNLLLKPLEGLPCFLGVSGLSDIADLERVEILSLGNRRYCKESRAEAIMSVLGVTDWYKVRNNHGVDGALRESFGRLGHAAGNGYPVEFLREAALKVGYVFYSSKFYASQMTIGLFWYYYLHHGASPQGPGTMLPFGTEMLPDRVIMLPERVLMCDSFSVDHPALKTWTIHEDMSVSIVQAGLISYTGRERANGGRIMAISDAPSQDSRHSLSTRS
ncbi:hypothetical protein BDW74DRAFT_100475 [Aspergillus multicolor]|uniref:uncharacterized protein n=1 Tax=Aspergillus multicolor TaxID=41759 RepID=UPI003CCD9767